MKFLTFLFATSVGKKVVMAATGLVLFGFVVGHLIGNLQIFLPPERINAYAHFLKSLGGGLWAIRAFLLLCLVLHVWVSVQLTLENRRARPAGYRDPNMIRASYASRTMRVSGFIALFFLIYHLLHFTFLTVKPEYREMKASIPGVDHLVPDVHAMMVAGFSNVWISLFYVVSVGLLSWHLSHGVSSMFQSVGLRTGAWSGFLDKASLAIALLYFIGNAAIPAAVLAGLVESPNPVLAAAAPAQEAAPSAAAPAP